jgi:antitoxin VapB
MKTAKLFQNGRSQAVRLPKEFRFEGMEVSISREGDAVVLRPVKRRQWPKDFFKKIRIKDSSFERPSQPDTPTIRGLKS